ncbi:aminomethyl transferase family protein [Streptomyces sp. NPDC006872]|uniref:aminomethyl transferase family protein n=1 Tax=Streptomyces sp. NPDC006872 TaxID=3155720 RepID=UPI0033FAC066
MQLTTLQERLEQSGSPTRMLSTPCPPLRAFPYPLVHTNLQDEQRAWKTTAVLFDQSYHMADLYITGPDTTRLLSETAVNSFATFGTDKAKQYLAVNEDGYVIGDGVLFGLSDDEVVITGSEIAPNWLRYQAEIRGYDVSFHFDDRSGEGPVPKRYYRYELEGPNAWKILEKAHGGKLDHIKFFAMGEFTIGDLKVRALNHTMGGVPGDDATGLELFGPAAEGPEFLAAILEAGEEFGLLRGGAAAYLSATIESGWTPLPIPAIFGDGMKPYRQWLSAFTTENWLPITGSFRSENIEDYYTTPWDIGYGHMVKFDHDFIGREALEEMAKRPKRRKVWLNWDSDDAARVIGSSFVDGDNRAKALDIPTTMITWDRVMAGERLVGLATMHGHTVNVGGWASIARVNVDDAVDGAEVEIVWGDPDGGVGNPFVASHQQTRIRATISTKPPAS